MEINLNDWIWVPNKWKLVRSSSRSEIVIDSKVVLARLSDDEVLSRSWIVIGHVVYVDVNLERSIAEVQWELNERPVVVDLDKLVSIIHNNNEECE